MRHTNSMDRAEAAFERLHRARCIVSMVARELGSAVERPPNADDIVDAEAALLAAAELILQGMAGLDTRGKELLPEGGG